MANKNWKKSLFLPLGIIFLFPFFASAKSDFPEAAPVSEQFQRWKESRKDTPTRFRVDSSSEEHATGFIPDPVRRSNKDLEASVDEVSARSAEIPKYGFSATFDLRDSGDVSSVKNQGSCGACWAFATAGSLESNWLVLGESESDLSENNMKECHRFEWTACDGGNSAMSTSYLTGRQGPVSEANDPYVDSEESCVSGLTPVAHVYEAQYLPDNSDIIKQALIDYGALFTSMYMNESSAYYNSSNHTYYYYGSADPNHAVTLIGWDDTKVTAGGTGAWIIKNSWDSSWGENGYFYVSYNDTKINSEVTVWTEKESYSTSTKLYKHDEIGAVGSIGYSDGTDYSVTKFTASGDQDLTRVGAWIPEAGATVSFWIYSGFDGSTFSGLLGSLENQSVTYAGYAVFDLSSSIPISSGSDFYVEAKFDIPGYDYPIPAEYSIAGYMEPSISTGKNWVSDSGSSWLAIGSGTGYNYDLGVRAYMEGDDDPRSVYRFWSSSYRHHFFTISETEKNSIIATYPESVWRYEGVGFYSYPSQATNTSPVYRFWSSLYRGHFFTISETEKNSIIATYPESVWRYEGVGFYGYKNQEVGSIPVYRFWSSLYRGHFFTISETEKNSIIATYPESVWRYEGVGFYVPENL